MQWQKAGSRLRNLPRHALGCLLLSMLMSSGNPAAYAFWWGPPAEASRQERAPVSADQEVARLVATIEKMAQDLTASANPGDPLHESLAEGVVVSSFVELKNLSRTSSFGRYLAEQLMSELQRQGYRIMELRKSTTIRMQEQRGEYGLSRNPEEVAPQVGSGALLTGTYTIGDDHILVNARLLDHRTTALLASATALFPQDALTRTLLADRISAGGTTKGEEIVYLKRLEP